MKTYPLIIRSIFNFGCISLLGLVTSNSSFGQAALDTPPEESSPVVLSEFVATSSRTAGYGATTAYTATRIGVPILQTPLNIQVVTAALIEDQAAYNFQNSIRYVSGVSGDSSSFEAGNLFLLTASTSTIRGFTPNVFLRNGFRRTANLSTENAERIEIVKGPASVFFGQSAPGGVVNIISRQPSSVASEHVDFSYGSYDFKKARLDVTGPLPIKGMAYRIYGSWLDADDWRDFASTKQKSFNPSFAWQVSDKLSVKLEYEYVFTKRNFVPYTLIGNRTYLANYANPPVAYQTALNLTAAQLRTRWLTNINQWIIDTRTVTGTTPFRITDYIPDVASRGLRFNTGGADQFIARTSHNATAEVNFVAANWLTIRAGANYGEELNRDLRSALTLGNGDGTVNLNPTATRNRSRLWIYQVDALMKANLSFVENKFVLGGQYTRAHTITRSVALAAALSPEGASFYRNYDAIAAAPIHLSHIPQTVSPPVAGADQINPTKGISLSWFGEWFSSKRLSTLIGVRNEEDVRIRSSQETLRRHAITPTYGFTYKLLDGVSAFASYSENFAPNGFRTITGGGVVAADNAQDLPVERGKGWDVGLKSDWADHRLSGSVTVFQVERANIPRIDSVANINDPRNANGTTQPGSVSHMTSSGRERSQGSELDFVWSPTKNYQALISGSYIWTAKVISDPSINPALIDYARQFQMGRRLRNTPKYMGSFWNKYTFSSGMLKGFATGGGLHYSAAEDPRATDLTSNLINPAFTTVDAMVSYQRKIDGHRVDFSLNVQNLFDRLYYEGNTGASDPRKIFFKVGLAY